MLEPANINWQLSSDCLHQANYADYIYFTCCHCHCFVYWLIRVVVVTGSGGYASCDISVNLRLRMRAAHTWISRVLECTQTGVPTGSENPVVSQQTLDMLEQFVTDQQSCLADLKYISENRSVVLCDFQQPIVSSGLLLHSVARLFLMSSCLVQIQIHFIWHSLSLLR